MSIEFNHKMTNVEAIGRLSQTQSAYISKLIWIAGAWECDRDIKEFLEDADADFFKKYMPQLNEKTKDKVAALIDYDLYGLLAEVHLPKNKNFRFVGGQPVSWEVSMGHCEFERIYAESLEGLIEAMEALSKAKFDREWKAEFEKLPPVI